MSDTRAKLTPEESYRYITSRIYRAIESETGEERELKTDTEWLIGDIMRHLAEILELPSLPDPF